MASSQIPAVITYHKPGTQPPLYVAGTFSDPPWQPHEMDHTAREDGEYDFKKEVRAEPGSKIQYKFRIGNGDWWVLKDDGPTMTDSSGNTNHVLEVKPQEETPHGQAADHRGAQAKQDAGPLSYAKVAAKRLQPPAEQAAPNRSGTGTPVSARVAAEVADSAELLHEEVPEREKPEGGDGKQPGRRMSDTAETAAEVADTAEKLGSRQSTVVILELPPGDSRPLKVQPRGEELPDDQEGYIADKSPLFAHECVGMYESDGEIGEVEEDDEPQYGPPVEDIDPKKIDLNDPTLERFPSARDDIMEAVRKLETGIPADHASFEGRHRSSVVNPSRRGTEDITGDFLLAAPQTPSPPTHRPSKKSPQGSVGSLNPTASLHSISEGDEPAAEEEEANFRPAVVFSNPLKSKPKHLKLPTRDEDEGIALRDGVSPRTVKPARPPIITPEASPPQSPPSPKTVRKGNQPPDASSSMASVEAEVGKDKGRSMEEVELHPPQSGNPGHAHPDPPKSGDKGAEHPEDPSDSKGTTSAPPRARRPSYAEVAASRPSLAEDPNKSTTSSSQRPSAKHAPESEPAAPQPASAAGTSDSSKDTAPPASSARRPSYAEVAASKPTSAESPGDDNKAKAKKPQPPTTTTAGESSASTSTDTAASTARDTDESKSKPKDDESNASSSDLRKRGTQHHDEVATTGESSTGVNVPAVHPRRGGGWIRAIFRLVFVDLVGGIIRRVLRMFGLWGVVGLAARGRG
ncbi:hypothetical protein C8A01DRAFT_40948 [Parachaetomium inaequale]|uniref:AMP-activated protein kinase glycogen-binding domain-containing protein n=1 Tax=Parachaetomium inaequale TaxID=2588326 RepID=A0AAN6P871_9PEZI|nr:hypothetical protein C8A01DRAFT_40948 [Parachaetomium inaequale]